MMITPPTPPDGFTLVSNQDQPKRLDVPVGSTLRSPQIPPGSMAWNHQSWMAMLGNLEARFCSEFPFYAIPNDKMDGLVAYKHQTSLPETQPDQPDQPDQPGSPLNSQVGGNHYKDFAIQPVEFITKNKLSFLEGCVIKRVCRHRSKNGAEDIRKAIHELELLLQLEYPTTNP